MNFQLDLIRNKIECFEAESIKALEEKIQAQIEANQAILLEVHNMSHQMHVTEEGKKFYSAMVHFKMKE